MDQQVYIKNKRAYFEYEIIDKLTAGIQLQGTEIKSIRNGQASINEAFCEFQKHEMFVINMHIAEYEYGTYANHVPKRPRKLLLQATELKRWKKKVSEKGLTIVPTALFIDDNGRAKLHIALAQGKKLHDKRNTMKDRDTQKQLDRLKKQF